MQFVAAQLSFLLTTSWCLWDTPQGLGGCGFGPCLRADMRVGGAHKSTGILHYTPCTLRSAPCIPVTKSLWKPWPQRIIFSILGPRLFVVSPPVTICVRLQRASLASWGSWYPSPFRTPRFLGMFHYGNPFRVSTALPLRSVTWGGQYILS